MTIVMSLLWDHIEKKGRDHHRDHTASLRKAIVCFLLEAHCSTFHRGKYPLAFQGPSRISDAPSTYSYRLVNPMVIKRWYLPGHLL